MKKKLSKHRSRNKRPKIDLEAGTPFTVYFQEAIIDKGKMTRWRAEMLDWLTDQHNRLEQLLLQYDPFDMLGNLVMLEVAHNPETYKETEHEGLAAVVEYVALIYLGHPYSMGAGIPLGLRGNTILEASARAKRILDGITAYYASEAALIEDRESEKNLDFLRFKTIHHEMFVRNPAYPHHQRHTIEELFTPYEAWLIAHVGFSVTHILRVEDAVKVVWGSHGQARAQAAKDSRAELVLLSDEARSGKTEGLHNLPHIRYLASLSRPEALKAIDDMSRAWHMSYIGSTTFAFTNEELADAAELPLSRVNALTKFFSLELGSGTRGFNMFSPTHELKSSPFIRQADQILYVTPGTLLWAIQPRLEEAIQTVSKSDVTQKNIWVSYQKSRGDYLEREALALFKSTLKQAQTYQSLSYTTTDNKGNQITTELDGLVVYDTTLFLVEAKAGNYVPAAKRGAKDSIKTVIKKLIGEAHAQAARAKKYILATDKCEFTLPDKSTLTIEGQRFARIIPVVVTLESLDIFNAALHEVAKTELLPAGELPWVVSLDILRVICGVNEFPTQLIHYLNRRLRLNEFKKFHAHDELDWFGLYLNKGLYYEQDEELEHVDVVNVQSQTDEFDAYYSYKLGIRKKKARQPRQKMPHLFRQLILELDELSAPGHSEAVLALLEWSSQTRSTIVSHLSSIRKRTSKDKTAHDFAFYSRMGSGITCVSDLSKNHPKSMERLYDRVTLRKYKHKASVWLGLLTLVDQPKLVHGFYIATEPWEEDGELDRLVEDMQPMNEFPFARR